MCIVFVSFIYACVAYAQWWWLWHSSSFFFSFVESNSLTMFVPKPACVVDYFFHITHSKISLQDTNRRCSLWQSLSIGSLDGLCLFLFRTNPTTVRDDGCCSIGSIGVGMRRPNAPLKASWAVLGHRGVAVALCLSPWNLHVGVLP